MITLPPTIQQLSDILNTDLLSKSHKSDLVILRQAIWYVMWKERTGYTLHRIAIMFEKKSHQTILHGINVFGNRLSVGDSRAVEVYERIKDLV